MKDILGLEGAFFWRAVIQSRGIAGPHLHANALENSKQTECEEM